MDASDYKAQATRLAKHLAEKHGVALKHASLLEAVAAMHGARDWNILVAKRNPLWQRVLPRKKPFINLVPSLDELQFEIPSEGLRIGLDMAQTEEIALGYPWLRRHLLVLGAPGVGAHSTVAFLAAQHVLRGGGVLWLCATPEMSDQNLSLLCEATAQVGRAAPQDISATPLQGLPSGKALEEGVFYAATERAAGAQAPSATGLGLLDHLLAQAKSWAGSQKNPPFMVVVQGAGTFGDPRWAEALAQARALGAMFVIQAQDLAELQWAGERFAHSIVANTGTKLLFQPTTPAELRAQTDLLRLTGHAAENPTLEQEFSSLGLGSAMLACCGRLQHVRTCMVDLRPGRPA